VNPKNGKKERKKPKSSNTPMEFNMPKRKREGREVCTVRHERREKSHQAGKKEEKGGNDSGSSSWHLRDFKPLLEPGDRRRREGRGRTCRFL